MFEQEILELMAKLNGAIWKKAETSGEFLNVYSEVFERAQEIENPGGLEGLTLLGDLGGWMPKKYGKAVHKCQRCGSTKGVIRKYGLYLCRKCFREVAKDIGFKKYS